MVNLKLISHYRQISLQLFVSSVTPREGLHIHIVIVIICIVIICIVIVIITNLLEIIIW